jgi:hypothetical protein
MHIHAANPASALPRTLPHAAMNLARATGQVRQLGPAYWEICCYDGKWWIFYEHGWLHLDDPAIVRELDTRSRILWAEHHARETAE